MDQRVVQAARKFELDQNHEKIYSDPNDLVEAGFPSSFLMPLLQEFRSGEGRIYFREGQIVDELIGISHLSLVYAIAENLGVPSDVGSGFSGRGFAMRANIDAIRRILDDFP